MITCDKPEPYNCPITHSITYRKGSWLHRTDGPAVIYPDGKPAWWVDGYCYKSNSAFQIAANISDEEMVAIILKYGDVK